MTHLGEELLEVGLALAVEQGAVGNHDVAAAALDAGDEELQGPAHDAVGVAGGHLAAGAEGGLAEHFDMVAALAGLDDAAVDRNGVLLGVLDGRHAGAVHGLGKNDFLGGGAGDPGLDFVAGLDGQVAFVVDEVLAVHDAVNLHADVHEHRVVGDFDDSAGNFLARLDAHLRVFLAGQKVSKVFRGVLCGDDFLVAHIEISLKEFLSI